MKPQRIISHSCALAAAVLVVLPAGAQAGSALSGYGGPGQGSQAVLGATLIGGHRGGSRGGGPPGGSGSAGGSATSAGTGEASSAGSQAQPGRASAGGSPGGGSSGGAKQGGGSRSSGSGRSASGSAGEATATGFYPAAEHTPAGGEGTVLGLTGTDLLYVILAAAILVLLGGLSWWMGDSSPRARADG